MTNKMKLKVILGSTRKGRQGEKVLNWTRTTLNENKDFEIEYIDLRDWQLPFFEEEVSPAYGEIENPLVKKWGAKIAEGDAYLILTPEYNHSFPAVLKNALDYLYKEWNKKPVAFISYSAGPASGHRAVEQLRLVAIELQMAPMRNEVNIPFIWEAFDEKGQMKNESMIKKLDTVITELHWWAAALKEARKIKAKA
jgi:NAD(P)H-dependent FMN reductase